VSLLVMELSCNDLFRFRKLRQTKSIIMPARSVIMIQYKLSWKKSNHLLEDEFDGAQGNYLETEDSLNINMFQDSQLEKCFCFQVLNCTPAIGETLFTFC